jgi:hypothetical protein
MTIEQNDRVYLSARGQYGRVSRIIKTGVPGVVQYQVEIENGDRGIFGPAFVHRALSQRAPSFGNVVTMPRRAPLRLAAVDGVAL